MRKGESEQVIEVFQNQLDANLIYVDATDRFLDLLADVDEPERKRKIIGGEFIKVFDEEARKLEGISFLAQGTIYPDILESDGVKAHHNVGGLPEDMDFELVEPVKLLFKDEVRVVGRVLGLPASMVERQPFPGAGPGRAVPGGHHPGPPGGPAGVRRGPAGGVCQGGPGGEGLAVLHRGAGLPVHWRAGRQAGLRLASNHPGGEYRGRHDGYGAGDSLGGASGRYKPDSGGGARRVPGAV